MRGDYFAGETLQANHIRDTERKGIAIIHQELALVKHLTVLENIFLGAGSPATVCWIMKP